MVDLILSHGFDFGLLGLGYFAIHRILSKKARELQFSFSLQNGIVILLQILQRIIQSLSGDEKKKQVYIGRKEREREVAMFS